MFGWPSFASYPLAAVKMGATPVRVPLTEHRYDVKRILAAVTVLVLALFGLAIGVTLTTQDPPSGALDTEL